MNESNLIEETRPARTAAAAAEVDILAGILVASSDACWCMEFGDPVDLTAPEQEIVRQVFENDPRWRFTNPAMARLYLLEEGVDFDSRPTSEIFPRNPQNEEFVLSLIANGFEIDAAPALDTRYDGVQIYVENDVRAHVADGKLFRMFGIVRDVGKQRHREERVQADLEEARDILATLPQPVMAFDGAGRMTAVNPAAERLLGDPAAELLGAKPSAAGLSAPICGAVAQVIDRGLPFDIEDAGLSWRIAPRSQGGAVATVCGTLSDGGA